VMECDARLPELLVDESTSPQDILLACTDPRDDDSNFTSTVVIDEKSGMEENSISGGHVDPAVECADGVVRELEASADEPCEACVSNQGDMLTEQTEYSNEGFVPLLSDASIPVQNIVTESQMQQDASNEMILCNAACVKQKSMEADAVEGSTIPYSLPVPESEAVEESIVPANKPDTDAASEMDSVTENQVLVQCSTSSPYNGTVTELMENKVIVEKLQEYTEQKAFETDVSVISGESSDAEMKTDADVAVPQSSTQDNEVLDAVDDVSGEMIDTNLHSVSECIDVNGDKGGELVDDSDDRGSHAEVTYASNVDAVDLSNEVDSHLIQLTKDQSSTAVECSKEELVDKCNSTTLNTEVRYAGSVQSEAPVSVSSESMLSAVIPDPVQEPEDSSCTVETCASEFTVVKCSKELTVSATACDRPALDMEMSRVRSVNVEARIDASNEIILSEISDRTSAEVDGNSELQGMTVLSDKDEELMDECDKTASFTGDYCTEFQAEAPVEIISHNVNAEEVPEAETSENKMQKPEEVSLPQPAVNTPDSMSYREFLQVEDHYAVDIGSSTDLALSCDTVHETEICSSKCESQSSSTDTVLEHTSELEKQSDYVESVIEDLDMKRLHADAYIIKDDEDILNESDSPDSALQHETEQLKQPPQGNKMISHVKMVSDDDGIVEETVIDLAIKSADNVHLEAEVDHAALGGEVNLADDVALATTNDLSPDIDVETVTVASLQQHDSAIVKEHERVASISISIPVTESESESEIVEAVAISLPVPESVSESEVVVESPIPNSEPVLKSEGVEKSMICTSLPIPESAFESEAVEDSTVTISAPVPDLATVETIHVVPCVPESELEPEVVAEFRELNPCTDRSCADELMMASDVAPSALDAGISLDDVEMECDKHTSHDGRTLLSDVDSDAISGLGKQASDTSTELYVPTMATTSNSIENLETEAQCIVSHVEHYEPSAGTCSDPSPPTDVLAASSENVLQQGDINSLVTDNDTVQGILNLDDTAQHEITISTADACAVSSEDTMQSEMMIITIDARSVNSVENTVVSSTVITDVLENVYISEHTVQSADEDALNSEENVQGRVTVFTGDEDAVRAMNKDTAALAKGRGAAVQSVDIISEAVKDTSVNIVRCDNTMQDGEMIPVVNEDTTIAIVSSQVVAEEEVSNSAAQKDITVCANNSESAIHSEDVITVTDEETTVTEITSSLWMEDTAVCVCDMVQRDILVSADDEDLPTNAGCLENTKQSRITTSMADNNSAENAEGLEDAVQSMDTISSANNDVDVHGEHSEDLVQSAVVVSAANGDMAVGVTSTPDTSQNQVVIDMADKDIVMAVSHPSDACVTAKQKEISSAVTKDQCQAGDITAYSTSQFNSQTSSGSVEEGQFDDVESDDSIEPVTPASSHWQAYRASPTLRAGYLTGGHTSSVLSLARRSLPPISPSSFTHSSANSPTSRLINRNTVSTAAGQTPRYSPLLSSPVGQNVDRPGTRPRFPQSPIMMQSGAHSSGTSFHAHTNSPHVAGNVASSSGEKLRKRKRSADDADVGSKRSLEADFVGDNTAIAGQCDIFPAENVLLSSGCDGENATLASAVVMSTLTQAAAGTGEMPQDVNEVDNATTLSKPVNLLPSDDCSSMHDINDTQTIKSFEVTTEVIVHDEGNAPIEVHSSIVDNIIPSQEDNTVTISNCLLNSESLNSDAEASGRPKVAEAVAQGFVPVNTNIPVATEVVESMETNNDECLIVSNSNNDISSQMDDAQPHSVFSVADAIETAGCSQPASSSEHVDVLPQCSSSVRTEVGNASDTSTSSVTTGTSHNQCIGDYTDKELLMHEKTSEVQLCNAVITASVEASSLDSCSRTLHAHTDTLTDMSRSNSELPDSLSVDNTDMHETSASKVLSLSLQQSSCIADSSEITSCQVQEVQTCVVEPLHDSDVSLHSELERCNSEMQAVEGFTADVLIAGGSIASQFISQASNNEVSASQATDVSDVFPSQCISQAAVSESLISCSQKNINPDEDGLKLYLELSQEPGTLHSSGFSQYVSQSAMNEVNVSCSQATTSADTDGLHLFLEPSQERNSLDALNCKKSNFTKDMTLLEEDQMSTEGESSLLTAGESDVMMEFPDDEISSHGTADGLETAGEMDDANWESHEDNHYGLHVQRTASELMYDAGQEQCAYESDLYRSQTSCQESGRVKEKMACGEVTSLQTANTVDNVSVQTDMTDVPCEMAVLNSYDNVEEFSTVENHALSIIAEEEENSDTDGTERLHDDDGDATNIIDKSSDNGAFQDAEVKLTPVKACSPVKHVSIAVVDAATDDGEHKCNNSEDEDGSDVTETMSAAVSSLNKDFDIMESSEKATVCLLLQKEKSSECTDVAAKNEDDNGASMMESIPGSVNGSGTDVDVTPVCEKTSENDVRTVSTDNNSDNNEDDTLGLSVMGNTSNIDSIADKGVDVIRPLDNATMHLVTKNDTCINATLTADGGDPGDDNNDADDDDDDDDDNSDVTPSMSDVGSDVGHLSDTEENVPDRHDSVSAVSPRFRQPVLTGEPGSLGDMHPEESFAGKYCFILLFFIFLN